MRHVLLALAALALTSITAVAQDAVISGTVTAEGRPLDLVGISLSGTTIGTFTNAEGQYQLSLPAGEHKLVASLVGYRPQAMALTVSAGERKTVDLDLERGVQLDAVFVTGTRAADRTALESPVPVDIIGVEALTTTAPQVQLNALLHTVAPSFSSNTQRISDGTDHIDPASLRGLGPDQVLVLINGKRRHTSSLVNINGTGGRGSVGTDLNALPASAFADIEVLRDGAAAQYGSDAIAGILNLQLREDVNRLGVLLSTGAQVTDRIGKFNGRTKPADGEVVNLALNYGLPLGDRGGLLHATGEVNFRGKTQRMEAFEGQIFNGFNAIERIAAADGRDVDALTLSDVQAYAQGVTWFADSTQDAIAALADADGLVEVLGFDATEQELAARGTERADYNLLYGQSEVTEGKVFVHGRLPVGKPEAEAELYAFGGSSYRRGCSGCFYRLPHQSRTVTSIYPDGHLPRINSNIIDRSLALGMRGKVGEWDGDFSVVQGSNEFGFDISETANATLGTPSPTRFDAGSHRFLQTTANMDLSRQFEWDRIDALNVAFGTEFRYENYTVSAGTPESYGNYDVNGDPVLSGTPDSLLSRDLLGRLRPAGAQCFAGYLPKNAVDARRTNAAAYLDLEADIRPEWLITGALRLEQYSDFGSTLNYKLATRYSLGDHIAIRGAHSTGFRAPSLQQKYANRTSTIFQYIDGVNVGREVGVFTNESRAAQLLGIPELKQETSTSYSAGLTAKFPRAGLRFTLDAFRIDVDDRVILTGYFTPGDDAELQAIFDQAGANVASFFANAISTRTQGIEFAASHAADFNANCRLKSDLAASFNRTRWNQDKGITASALLEEKGLVDTYFDQGSRILLERSMPGTQVSLGHTLEWRDWTVYLRNVYYGATIEVNDADIFDDDLNVRPDSPIDPVHDPRILTDLTIGRQLGEGVQLTLGANNLLDVYPERADDALTSDGRFIYARYSPQFGIGGRFLFVRAVLDIR